MAYLITGSYVGMFRQTLAKDKTLTDKQARARLQKTCNNSVGSKFKDVKVVGLTSAEYKELSKIDGLQVHYNVVCLSSVLRGSK